MDAREELIALLVKNRQTIAGSASDYVDSESTAELILAAGYRKMPDREAVTDAIYNTPTPKGVTSPSEWPFPVTVTELADAILALMDGNK